MLLLVGFLILPLFQLFSQHANPVKAAFLLPGGLIFLPLTARVMLAPVPVPRTRAAWIRAAAVVILGIALFAVGGWSWVTAIAFSGAVVGRSLRQSRLALGGSAAVALIALVLALHYHGDYGSTLTTAATPLLAGFFGYTAARRREMVARLRRTQDELAHAAVAEERLRIARDLHDLLGHSLSLITLKAELANRTMTSRPDRAAREVAEIETVARESLAQVRAAISGYRQPTLGAELAAARRILAAAGIGCTVSAPGTGDLTEEADALLAWTVREGATNIARHSGATAASITVSLGPGGALAEIADNGPATATPPGAAVRAGSGLAGLAERAAASDGTLTAEPAAGGGFLLRVHIPSARAAQPGPTPAGTAGAA